MFGGMCFGTSASKRGRQKSIIVIAGAKVYGCDGEAAALWNTEPVFWAIEPVF